MSELTFQVLGFKAKDLERFYSEFEKFTQKKESSRHYPHTNWFDDFSREEREIAEKLHPMLVENDMTYEEVEEFLSNLIEIYKVKKNKSKVQDEI